MSKRTATRRPETRPLEFPACSETVDQAFGDGILGELLLTRLTW